MEIEIEEEEIKNIIMIDGIYHWNKIIYHKNIETEEFFPVARVTRELPDAQQSRAAVVAILEQGRENIIALDQDSTTKEVEKIDDNLTEINSR